MSRLSRRMAPLLCVVVLWAGVSAAQEAAAPPMAFAPATPESQGLSSAELKELAGVVAGFVKEEKILGAELLVIKNRRAVLHETFGFRDVEQKLPFQRDTICCVRSMTKPLVGVAAQMLIEEGKLNLEDTIAKHLPAFDNDKSRGITLPQVLSHTSGLPLSSLLKVNYRTLKGVCDVADLTGKNGPQFPPGSRFNYSDDGTDTVGAVVAEVSGQPLEEFIQKRLLDPLGMTDSAPLVKPDDPRLDRFASAYSGAAGHWTKISEPGKVALFPYFLASQSLYSTPRDYAKFLALFLDQGKANGKTLLNEAVLRRVLTPAPKAERFVPTGFESYRLHYGQLMMLYLDGSGKLAAFGHGGSDGTHAYAWPDRDLMVLYFTQSRGNLTYIDFEEALERMLLKPAGAAPKPTVTAESVAPFTGFYWDEAGNRPFVIRFREKRLAIEFPWESLHELKPEPDGRWSFRLRPTTFLQFQRDEAGNVVGVRLERANRPPQTFARLERGNELPSAETLMKLRRDKLKADQFTALGTLRLQGTMTIGAGKSSFTMLTQGWNRYRSELTINGVTERTLMDGEKVWLASRGQPGKEAAGIVAEQARLDHPAFFLADWSSLFKEVHVLKRIELDGKPVFVVWCVPAVAHPRNFYVHAESGRLLASEYVEQVPGIGAVGQRITYENYREVGGISWPHRTTH